jgi:hypothetical protein
MDGWMGSRERLYWGDGRAGGGDDTYILGCGRLSYWVSGKFWGRSVDAV